MARQSLWRQGSSQLGYAGNCTERASSCREQRCVGQWHKPGFTAASRSARRAGRGAVSENTPLTCPLGRAERRPRCGCLCLCFATIVVISSPAAEPSGKQETCASESTREAKPKKFTTFSLKQQHMQQTAWQFQNAVTLKNKLRAGPPRWTGCGQGRGHRSPPRAATPRHAPPRQ